jgi:monoamine oxidase
MNSGFSRRHFLRSAGSLLLLARLGSTVKSFAQGERVLVLGAGMAGISAARALADVGCSVTVLEARDVAGGRIRTDMSLGAPLDLGASFIHGTKGNPLVALASRFGAATYDIDQGEDLYVNAAGGAVSTAVMNQAEREYNATFKRLLAIQDGLSQDISIGSVSSPLIKRIRQRRGAAIGDMVNFLVRSEIGIEFGADLNQMSLKYFDQDEAFSGSDLLLKPGYISLIDGLAQGLDIRFNQLVRGISWSSSGVRVTTESGVFDADRAIITLPLGVLKRGDIEFSPGLPTAKANAIAKLRMGVLDKTYFKFPTAFWQTREDSIGFIGNVGAKSSTQIPEYYTLDQALGVPILFGFTAGAQARRFEQLDLSTISAASMASFRKIFGSSVPEPEAVMQTRWSSDPYSYGSYSYISVGAKTEYYDTLARPINNRVFFAGEATHRRYPGTVHGAYLSGIREANLVVKSLS